MRPALNSFVRKSFLWLRAVWLRPPRALPSALALLRAPSTPTPSPLSATGAGRRPGSCPKRRSTSLSAPHFSPVRQARPHRRRAPGGGAVSRCEGCVAVVLALSFPDVLCSAPGAEIAGERVLQLTEAKQTFVIEQARPRPRRIASQRRVRAVENSTTLLLVSLMATCVPTQSWIEVGVLTAERRV